eukprot:TRINITY_DN7857_c0_g1_i1.p1 TRINITY_DN7857_c0_g1~~TRINITY_DN7857_c0_g1_i1.p1  ORF type:complete len:180 (-),score=44.11 TRINITY_DN7857_c0_g1_i1:376-915(-)
MPNAIHWEKYLDKLKLHCTEMVFPINENDDADWIKIGECVQQAQKIVEEFAKKSIYPLNLSLEMRFTGGGKGLLSPAREDGKDHACYMEIVSSKDAPQWKDFSNQVVSAWRKIFPNAKPHWAKECYQLEGIEAWTHRLYGDRIAKFLEIRKKLNVDPINMFYTQWIGSILEPTKYPKRP